MRARLLGVTLLAGAIPALAVAQTGSPYVAPPAPVQVERVSGDVRVRDTGGWRPLRAARRVVLGSTQIDARRGRVRVIAAQRLIARGGVFDIAYDDAGVLELRLRGGSFSRTCSAARISSKADAGKRSVRRLWADGHGRFRTRGRYSAATVRGTRWLVEDRCEGTITEVARGEVEVEDFTVPPEPTPTPGPQEGIAGQPAPAAAPNAPGKDSGSKPRRVRIKRGQRYIAGPAR